MIAEILRVHRALATAFAELVASTLPRETAMTRAAAEDHFRGWLMP